MSENEFSVESLKDVFAPDYSIFTDATDGGDHWDDLIEKEAMSAAGVALVNAGFHFEPGWKNPGSPDLRWMRRGDREELTYCPLTIEVCSALFEKMAKREGCGLKINFRFRDGAAVHRVVLELLKIGCKVLAPFQNRLFIIVLEQNGRISVREKRAPSIVEKMTRWEEIRERIENLKNELRNQSSFRELEVLEKELSDEYCDIWFKREDCYMCGGTNTRITEEKKGGSFYQFWSFCTACGLSQSDGGSL